MARRVRIFSPLFVTSLAVFIGSTLSVVLLHAPVLACTVGFNTLNQPLSAGQAARCPSYEIASAVLITLGLAMGAVLIWLGVRLFRANARERPEQEEGDLVNGADSRATQSRLSARLLAWPTHRWVCLLIAVFFAATFFASSWGYLHLVAVNGGAEDLTVNQQALSSTILGGKPYPFYEAFNCGRHGQCSFLEVHQAFVAYAIALVYALAPTAFTLFALQSLALGLAALPLYALAVDVIGSRRLSLAVSAAYLAWVPLYASSVSSFHWEAFVPVEMLTLFWLWNRQRYLLAIPVALLSFVTIEAVPVLTFLVGLYFVWPWLIKAVRLFFQAVFRRSEGPKVAPSKLRLWARWIRRALYVPEVYASLGLMAGSLAAYVLLRLFVLDGLWLLGLPPVPSAYALPISSPNKDFVLSFAAASLQWNRKLVFWIVVYVTLGFVPLLAPRALLLVLPWIGFAVFNTNAAFWTIGNQYLFLPAAALFIGFVFGLNQLYRWTSTGTAHQVANPSTALDPPSDAPITGSFPAPNLRPWALDGRARSDTFRASGIITIGVVIIVGGNLFLNPLNPLATSVASNLGRPFPLAYGDNLAPLPDNQALQELVSIIPKNAIIAAPPPVYTLVADDPYAYPMVHFTNPPYNDSLLPGNESNRVDYVLLPYNTPSDDFTTALLGTLYDRSYFGVRGCVSTSGDGGVELFQRNYSGAAEVFGAADPLCPNYFAAGTGLVAGPNGTMLDNISSPSGVVVQSLPCAAGPVWTGPGIDLPSGTYTLGVVYSVNNSGNPACKNLQVKNWWKPLIMNVTGENASGPVKVAQHYFSVGDCIPTCVGWHYWNVTFTLQSPISEFSLTGTATVRQYVVQVAYVLVDPVPS